MNEFLIFLAGIAIGGLLSWLITHHYYLIASKEQKDELNKLKATLRPRNTLHDFEELLLTSEWTISYIVQTKTWIANSNSTFQIEAGESTSEFKEKWTTVYPDINSTAYPIYLKINGTIIKELTFVSMDGGRIFVPIAEVRLTPTKEIEYFWNLNSLEVYVCRIIGSYYIYGNLEGIAKMSRVALVE